MSIIKQTSIVIISSLFALSALIAAPSEANTNPFSSQGLMTVISMHDNTDAKCGEGKAKAGHKCGEGKCGEGKAKAAAKCGEGKVKATAKCGEGKCGEGKIKAKKCGG